MNIKAIEAKKHLGQNFLVDKNIAIKIVELLGLPSGGRVLEIGPGTGALTKLMVERGYIIDAVEIDERAVSHLREHLPSDHVTVHHTSIERFDIRGHAASLEAPLTIVGNIPYNLTSEILFRIFDNADCISRAVIMMQREVAMRLTAPLRSKEYGVLTVAAAFSAKTKRRFDVSPHSFSPQPKVTSSVVTFDCGEMGLSMPRDIFRKTMVYVRAGFQQRRKKLSNALKSTEAFSYAADDAWLQSIAEKRAEELSPKDFVLLREKVEMLHSANRGV